MHLNKTKKNKIYWTRLRAKVPVSSLSNPPRSPLNHIGGKESIALKGEGRRRGGFVKMWIREVR
jgi:hypothetical protein